jgi:CRISPR system Cascade subunit CasA
MQSAVPRFTISLLAAGAALVACSAYNPSPIDPAVVLQQKSDATVDLPAVRSEIARLAPEVEWDGRSWNSLSLLAAALTANPDIANARAAVSTAQAEAKAADQSPGPALSLTTEYAFNAPESSPWLFGIASDFTIDTGVRRQSRVDIADLSVRIAVFDYMDVAWSVRLRIRRAMTELLLTQQEISIANDLTGIQQRRLLAMEHRVSAGAASYVELQRVRSDLAADQRLLADVNSRATAAMLSLAAAIGVSVDALDTRELDWPDIGTPHRYAAPLPEFCQSESLLARSDVARASLAYDQAESALQSAVAAQYPVLHIGPGYTWERGLKKLPFSLGLALPPLDFNRAAIDAANARRAEAGSKLEATVSSALNALELAQHNYRAAWTQFEKSQQQRSFGEQLAAQAEARLSAGAIDRIDWSIAQSASLAAKLDELAAIKGVRDAETLLEDTLRRPLDGPELAINADQPIPREHPCQPNPL